MQAGIDGGSQRISLIWRKRSDSRRAVEAGTLWGYLLRFPRLARLSDFRIAQGTDLCS